MKHFNVEVLCQPVYFKEMDPFKHNYSDDLFVFVKNVDGNYPMQVKIKLKIKLWLGYVFTLMNM